MIVEQTSDKKVADTLAFVNLLKSLVETFGSVIIELIRAAANMPLLAAILAIILSDILEALKVIQPTSALTIKGIVLAATGIELTNALIDAIANLEKILPFTNPSTPPSDLLKPGATTIVYGPPISGQDLQALMALVGRKN